MCQVLLTWSWSTYAHYIFTDQCNRSFWRSIKSSLYVILKDLLSPYNLFCCFLKRTQLFVRTHLVCVCPFSYTFTLYLYCLICNFAAIVLTFQSINEVVHWGPHIDASKDATLHLLASTVHHYLRFLRSSQQVFEKLVVWGWVWRRAAQLIVF